MKAESYPLSRVSYAHSFAFAVGLGVHLSVTSVMSAQAMSRS